MNPPSPFGTADYVTPELINVLCEAPYNHERDTRAFNVERILSLSNAELANLRAPVCPDPSCNECPCHREGCERYGCGRHSVDGVKLPSGAVKFVCARELEVIECDNCCKPFPRWQLVKVPDTGSFCAKCSHTEIGSEW